MALIFPMLFLQGKVALLNAFAILGLFVNIFYNFVFYNKTLKYCFLFYWFTPFLYVIVNMLLTKGYAQLWSFNFYKNEGDFFVSWILFLMFYLFVSFSSWSDKKLIWYFVIGSIVVLIASVPFNISNHYEYFLGFFSSHNAVSGMLASIIIVLIGFIRYVKSRKALFLAILFLISLFVWSQSRAFSLALFFSVVFLLYRIKIIRFSSKGLFGVFLLLLFAAIIFALQIDRFMYALSGDDYNTVTRFFYWEKAYGVFLNNPVCGIGYGMFNDTLVGYFNESNYVEDGYGFYYGGRHAHNIILQILSELGLIGLVVFVVSYIMLMRGKSNNHYVNIIGDSLFVLLLVASMFGLNFFTPSTSLVFYYFIALRWRPNGSRS